MRPAETAAGGVTEAEQLAAARAYLAVRRPSAMAEKDSAIAGWLRCSTGQELRAALAAAAAVREPALAARRQAHAEEVATPGSIRPRREVNEALAVLGEIASDLPPGEKRSAAQRALGALSIADSCLRFASMHADPGSPPGDAMLRLDLKTTKMQRDSAQLRAQEACARRAAADAGATALRAENDRLRGLMRRCEENMAYCSECGVDLDHGDEHTPDCVLAAALRPAGETGAGPVPATSDPVCQVRATDCVAPADPVPVTPGARAAAGETRARLRDYLSIYAGMPDEHGATVPVGLIRALLQEPDHG